MRFNVRYFLLPMLFACSMDPLQWLRTGALQAAAVESTPGQRAMDAALAACDRARRELPRMATVAKIVAERHLTGGLIGFPFQQQSLAMELWGRSGGMIHVGFDRPFKKDRSDAEKAMDVAIIGYDRPPGAHDLDELDKLRARSCYIVGFGPRDMPSLKGIVAVCDASMIAEPNQGQGTMTGEPVKHVEKYWCSSFLGSDIIAGSPFRSKRTRGADG